MSQPWDRQRTEGAKAYRGFLAYRDLGPNRTLLEAWRRYGGDPEATELPGYYGRWSHDHAWVFRADQWDVHLQGLVDAELQRRAVASVEQDIRLVNGLIGVSASAVRILGRQFGQAIQALEAERPMPEGTPQVTPASLATLVESTVKLHRLLMGQVTERTEEVQRETEEVAKARDDLERKLDAVAQRLAKSG